MFDFGHFKDKASHLACESKDISGNKITYPFISPYYSTPVQVCYYDPSLKKYRGGPISLLWLPIPEPAR